MLARAKTLRCPAKCTGNGIQQPVGFVPIQNLQQCLRSTPAMCHLLQKNYSAWETVVVRLRSGTPSAFLLPRSSGTRGKSGRLMLSAMLAAVAGPPAHALLATRMVSVSMWSAITRFHSQRPRNMVPRWRARTEVASRSKRSVLGSLFLLIQNMNYLVCGCGILWCSG